MTTGGVLESDPPRFSGPEVEAVARDAFGVRGSASPLVSERDQNLLLEADDGSRWVVKIANAAEAPAVIEMEVAAVARVAEMDPRLPVAVAKPALDGRVVASVRAADGREHLVRLLPALPGTHRDPADLEPATIGELGRTVARLGRALRGFFHPAAGRLIEWDLKQLPSLEEHAAAVADTQRRRLLDEVLARYHERVLPALPGLRAQVIHDDVTLDNLLFADGRVSGILDFGDMSHTALVFDIPATLQSLLRNRTDLFAVSGAFLDGYAAVTAVETDEAELLGDLLAARMAQTILISAWRMPRWPENDYITGWAEPAWALLDQLREIGFDRAAERLAQLALQPGAGSVPSDADLVARRRVLGSALSPLSYRHPLQLVRGHGAWMVDAEGRAYLDAYNNVPVVGHAHPRVVAAIARQAALLNTNTRYLHRAVVELGERITASMPPGLDTVMFVNSGSEANDLAWRLATSASGAAGGIVSAWAYHGVTAAIADLSPSEWPPGPPPAAVATVPAPDPYRGAYRDAADPAARATQLMADAVAGLAERGHRPAILLLDALFTSDGIFDPPPPLVRSLIRTARDAGALWIADEVQAGHGRGGDGLWSFATWGVVPDVVTLGKPMGNGHPIAAVVTRAELVDRFAAETEFFSTFGGNPVACAAALAVLDVIEDEDLVANAASVGERLRADLRGLAPRHAAIGEVRGRGLLVGVEMVTNGAARTPATELAARVRDEMREAGVLIGTTGRDGNVLKIRPPLCIGPDEATLIVEALDEVLRRESA